MSNPDSISSPQVMSSEGMGWYFQYPCPNATQKVFPHAGRVLVKTHTFHQRTRLPAEVACRYWDSHSLKINPSPFKAFTIIIPTSNI